MLAIVIGGYHVAKSAIYSLKTLTMDMNFLMTIAIIGAVFIGQWEEAATVVFLFALGNALQSYTMDKTRNSIRSLITLSPKEASVIRDGKEIKLNTGLIKVDDIMVVRPGEKIAMDGIVAEGSSYVDQANITGESMPVEKIVGSEIFAGTINGTGSMEVRVTKLARDNTLSKIIQMVEEAQANKAPTQVFLDRFTKYYTPAVIGLAACVVIIPTLLGQPIRPVVLQRARTAGHLLPLRAGHLYAGLDRIGDRQRIEERSTHQGRLLPGRDRPCEGAGVR